jgi:hypothetical protein
MHVRAKQRVRRQESAAAGIPRSRHEVDIGKFKTTLAAAQRRGQFHDGGRSSSTLNEGIPPVEAVSPILLQRRGIPRQHRQRAPSNGKRRPIAHPLKDTTWRLQRGRDPTVLADLHFDGERIMNSIVYIVGLVVIVGAILAFLGLR